MAAGSLVAGDFDAAGRGVDSEGGGGGDGAADSVDLVAPGAEIFGDGGVDALVEGEAAELGGGHAEGADVMLGGVARAGDGLGWCHAEVDEVEEDLEGGLVLEVAAGDADGHDGFSVVEDHGGREGDARAFAGFDLVGMSFGDGGALEAGAEPDAGVAGEDAGPAAGGGGHDVSGGVGDEAGGGVGGGSTGADAESAAGVGEEGVPVYGIAGALFEGGDGRIN